MADTDLTNSIAENAQGPASASGDGQSVTQHSLTDLIAADRYLLSKRAAKRGFGGIKMVKFSPPGAANVDLDR